MRKAALLLHGDHRSAAAVAVQLLGLLLRTITMTSLIPSHLIPFLSFQVTDQVLILFLHNNDKRAAAELMYAIVITNADSIDFNPTSMPIPARIATESKLVQVWTRNLGYSGGSSGVHPVQAPPLSHVPMFSLTPPQTVGIHSTPRSTPRSTPLRGCNFWIAQNATPLPRRYGCTCCSSPRSWCMCPAAWPTPNSAWSLPMS